MANWDLELLKLINQEWTASWLDWLMPAISAIEAWMPPLVVLAFFLAVKGGRPAKRALLCCALAIGIGDGLISNTLKKSIGRERPRDVVAGVVVRDLGLAEPAFMRLFEKPTVHEGQLKTPAQLTGGKSFPSSHTINMFAVATVLACFYRRLGIATYLLAAAVAYSRIYCGAHWPSDIPPSIALGLLTGLGVVWGVRRLDSKPATSA